MAAIPRLPDSHVNRHDDSHDVSHVDDMSLAVDTTKTKFDLPQVIEREMCRERRLAN
jgi:hypothetical protein